MPGMNGEMPLLILPFPVREDVNSRRQAVGAMGNEFRSAMKKILGMEDGRIPHAAFCRSRFSTTSFP